MDLHFQYKRQEVIDALRFHFLNRPEMKLFKTILIIMVLFAFVGYFAHFVTLQMLIWIFLLFVVVSLFFWYILPYSVYRKAKTFQEPEITLRWNKEHLLIGTRRGESTLPWSRLSNIIETKHFFYLYSSGKSFFLIPGHAFSDREERVAFSEMLQNQCADYTFK